MHYAHLKHLIDQAISSLEENAEALREAHMIDDEWPKQEDWKCKNLAEAGAKSSYEREITLVAELRAALPEFSAYHETAKGLEQLLRDHRLQGAAFRYQDLAALLPKTPEENG